MFNEEKNNRLKILLVDDHQDVLEVLAFKIKELFPEISIKCVTSGLSAINLLKEGVQFDLIITDYEMVEMNGLELVGHIYKQFKAPRLVLLSSYIDILSNVENFDLGFDSIIEKPVDYSHLFDEIRRLSIPQKFDAEGYVRFPLAKLRGKVVFPFTIYLNFNDQKVVPLFCKDDPINQTQLETLIQKAGDRFFVSKNDIF